MAHYQATCYVSGVHIRTSFGDATVESINPGDMVVVVRGGQEVLEAVLWTGRCNIDLSSYAHVEDAAPVRIRQNAISVNRPARDLLVSPEHCMVLDGRCVPAKLLVNGGSITSERDHPPFQYHHIELVQHGILLAENTPSESYLDTGNRFLFSDVDQPGQLHPTFTLNATSSRWITDACLPLAKVPEEVDPIWSRLAARSAQLGFPVPMLQTSEDAELHVLADGCVIMPISDYGAQHVFLVPAGVASVSLISRFCIPSDKMVSSQRDTRRLGVRVNWLSIRSMTEEMMFAADHPALQAGWNDVEKDSLSMWRWTDGNGSIPWDVNGSAILTVRCTPVDNYPVYDAKLHLVT